MPLVKAQCTNCGGKIEVNSEAEHLICKFCGMEFVVQDAINTYNTSITNNNTYNIASANIALDGFNEKDELNNAKNMINHGDFESAIKKYEDIYIHNPNNADASLLKNSEKFDIDKVWSTVKTLTQEGSSKSDVISLLIYKHKSEFAMTFNKSEIDFNEFLKITKDFIDQHLVDDLVKTILDDLFNDLYNELKKLNDIQNKENYLDSTIIDLYKIKSFKGFFNTMIEKKYYCSNIISDRINKFNNSISKKLKFYKESLMNFHLLSNDITNKIDDILNGFSNLIKLAKKVTIRAILIIIGLVLLIVLIISPFIK